MKKPIAFLDACVWLRGIAFPHQASGWILYLSMLGELKVVASPLLIGEVKKNLRRRDKPHFSPLIQTVNPEIIEVTDQEIIAWSKVVVLKDCHVLAGAVISKADVLVTLDSEHILKQKVKKQFPLPILNPDECLSWLAGRKHRS